MTNYGNASNNYRNAAGRQADNVLRDEEFGYYAANGRNVSLRVDMNHWMFLIYSLTILLQIDFWGNQLPRKINK